MSDLLHILVTAVNAVVPMVLLIVLVEVLNVPQTIAPLLNLLITSPINFLVHKYWVFRKKK